MFRFVILSFAKVVSAAPNPIRTYLVPKAYDKWGDNIIRDYNSQDKFMNHAWPRVQEPDCSDDLETLSVGDVELTSANYIPFKKDNRLFVLGISNRDIKNCPLCCMTERILDEVH